MNARALTLPPAMAALRTQLIAKWRSTAARERLMLIGGLAVLIAFLVWLLLIAPAWHIVREAPAKLDRLEAQLQQMQRLATEAKSLRGAPELSPAQAMEPLKVATERLGASASISFQGDRATLTINGVQGEALRDWLSEARSASHARPIEVTMTRSANGYTGSVVVTLGASS